MKLIEIKIFNSLDHGYRTVVAAYDKHDYNTTAMCNLEDVTHLLDSTVFDQEYDQVVSVSRLRIANISSDSMMHEQVNDEIKNLTR
jgi:hypothetical protein